MKKRLSIPLLICAGLLVYALIAEPPRIIQAPEPVSDTLRIPESYAHEVRVRDFDEQGQLIDQTNAQALRRYEDQLATELDTLESRHFSEGGPWIAEARQGFLNEFTERLRLEGDVQLRYESDGVRFLSQSMTVNLGERTARSNAPVRAWQGPNETRAERLFVNLDRQIATLNGMVRTEYQPPGEDR